MILRYEWKIGFWNAVYSVLFLADELPSYFVFNRMQVTCE
jgi:hypothetical protein